MCNSGTPTMIDTKQHFPWIYDNDLDAARGEQKGSKRGIIVLHVGMVLLEWPTREGAPGLFLLSLFKG